MIDRKFIGMEIEPRQVVVERGQLRLFAKATGERNALYFDTEVARVQGHPDLLAPPTFCFTLDLLCAPQPSILERLGVDLGHVLHGEQVFSYHAPIHAGDMITLRSRITDITAKKGGALELVTVETDARNESGELCVRFRGTAVVRRPLDRAA